MKAFYLIILFFLSNISFGQGLSVKGQLFDDQGEAVSFANVILYSQADNVMTKAEVSDMEGKFEMRDASPGDYYLMITFLGLEDKRVELTDKSGMIDLERVELKTAGIQIETTVVTAKRALVEVKSDKTVFNVEGTINSAGDDALGLLRKAPGLMVDNNNSISVLGRTGVLVYINGRKLPLAGDELTDYLESLTSEQIDRIDIISNPGAKYEAEGNAGIIDIRLKKNKNLGTNATLSGSVGKGVHPRFNTSLGANHRAKKFNLFGNASYSQRVGIFNIFFEGEQNDFSLVGFDKNENDRKGIDARIGTDFFINEKSTIGFLYNSRNADKLGHSISERSIASQNNRNNPDSILIAQNESTGSSINHTANLNYMYNFKGRSLNIDADFGTFRNTGEAYQPNAYVNALYQDTLSSSYSSYFTPVQIDIYTLKADYEQEAFGGNLGFGAKFSKVVTDNTFEYSELLDDDWKLNPLRSNQFIYDENVYAAYINYNSKLSDVLSVNAGLRVELTDATGDLTVYEESLSEEPVELYYTDYFPSAGLSYIIKEGNTFNLNYGRRLNRPDYNVLNPFKEQKNELSFQRGNPFLEPEIVNNFELGYTHGYRYNFKLSFSRTLDQITRLIGPDESDPRANFLKWENLAVKDVYAANASIPIEFTKWWNAFFNLTGTFTSNKAEYEDGGSIDLQVWGYSIYTQQTFNLPLGLTGEVSTNYYGPGIWGGVYRYEANFLMDLGLQKKFLKNNLNVKLSFSDIFGNGGFKGESFFNGLQTYSHGNWDSRRLSLSVSYKWGNSKIKSRKRKTGIEEESKRVSD